MFNGSRIFLLVVVALQSAVVRIQFLRHKAAKFLNAFSMPPVCANIDRRITVDKCGIN
jgi:hypothetical protein